MALRERGIWATFSVGHISTAADDAITLARERGRPVFFDFNGILLSAWPYGTPEGVVRSWREQDAERSRRRRP